MTLGEKLSEKRRERGLTQESVAEALGVTPQAVSKWENDASCPDIMLLPAIARLYETTTDELLSPEAQPVAAYTGKKRKMDDAVLRIIVEGSDEGRVKINLPILLIRAVLAGGGSLVEVAEAKGINIDWNLVMSLVENGAIGRILEVEGAEGTDANVIIEVVY